MSPFPSIFQEQMALEADGDKKGWGSWSALYFSLYLPCVFEPEGDQEEGWHIAQLKCCLGHCAKRGRGEGGTLSLLCPHHLRGMPSVLHPICIFLVIKRIIICSISFLIPDAMHWMLWDGPLCNILAQDCCGWAPFLSWEQVGLNELLQDGVALFFHGLYPRHRVFIASQCHCSLILTIWMHEHHICYSVITSMLSCWRKDHWAMILRRS